MVGGTYYADLAMIASHAAINFDLMVRGKNL